MFSKAGMSVDCALVFLLQTSLSVDHVLVVVSCWKPVLSAPGFGVEFLFGEVLMREFLWIVCLCFLEVAQTLN